MSPDERYLHRCFQLARLGAGSVSPNPLVGAVLVHNGRIIGEGWHRQFGAAHAEVNALATVAPEDRHLIPQATLYCSLEPCSHQGKTPPCADLIVREKIARVVVSNTDPNPLVAGQGLEKLRAAGIPVEASVLQREGYELNRPFFTWITQKRPYIILKWAESADGFLGRIGQRTSVSGPLAQRLVHRWRSEADAILVGAATARVDDPRLDNRLYFGKSPLRIALDFRSKLPPDAHLLDDSAPTWILGPGRPGNWQHTRFLPLGNPGETASDWIPGLLEQLRTDQKAILLVEGGASVLQQ
ncbi:MAG: bifunctional diaminohydroxyphosphoribosylaminopyrimidine deaminase/5-amino-6-(5-phosphoribosylamino)uracil reductase RibD, partial [Saprospiraceae bacterium]|nr:bifunctional diaminohydroxyphosphoribosylaminopyrimidine deaminase/5-amino-6-(5-phosphoribosylamino)uracil reductase RibD [Saprospiraceae bacterium]